jgi:hypothetical protein
VVPCLVQATLSLGLGASVQPFAVLAAIEPSDCISALTATKGTLHLLYWSAGIPENSLAFCSA